MDLANLPLRIPAIWGNAASGTYIQNPVPTTSQIGITNGAASFNTGFVPLSFVPLAAGGAGPFGKDFNGILNQITADVQWIQAGGHAIYNGSFSSAIGGYPKGATLQDSTNPHIYYVSTVDANVTNPEAGGAGWDRFQLGNAALLLADSTPGTRNFTMTAGNTKGIAILTGAGGGGAGANSAHFTGGGGAAGGTVIFYINQAPGTITTYTIGTGGANGTAATSSASDGAAGGSSSFGAIASASGGAAGHSFADAAGGDGGLGVVSIGSGVPLYGGAGGDGVPYADDLSAGNGGASFWGGGSRGSTTGSGATAALGSGGGGGYTATAGSPGIAGCLVILGLGG